jgi:integrase
VLGALLQFGVGRQVLTANLAKGVRPFKGETKERFLSEAEMARLADTLITMQSEGLNLSAAATIRLLLLTGCRKSEILALRWEHVDFERHCLRLPDSKTGAKVVPIAAVGLAMKSAGGGAEVVSLSARKA